MSKFSYNITDFKIRPPKYLSSQQHSFDWLIAAHIEAESNKKGGEDPEAFRRKVTERLYHVGCKPGIIDTRGHELSDFLHEKWDEMMIYRLKEHPQGKGLTARSEFHAAVVDAIFEEFYEGETDPPSDLIHVSCTGYDSPSSGQKIVSKKSWQKTTVTHAYHMGCYAVIPALRIAQSFRGKSDIIHTELCTLHNNPSSHESSDLVVQSLFADGFIKYSGFKEMKASQPHFTVLGILEEIIPNSLELMAWHLSDWGFKFVLSREIPVLIAKHLTSYIEHLCEAAFVTPKEMIEKGLFAIHPGGPKILDYAKKWLNLSEDQLLFSRKVLRECGNMSSATLPHIWEAILKDPDVLSGTKILSLAFGPGLTIAGAVLEKRE